MTKKTPSSVFLKLESKPEFRELIKRKNFTIEKLALKADVSTTTVNKFLKAKREDSVRVENAFKILQALDIPEEDYEKFLDFSQNGSNAVEASRNPEFSKLSDDLAMAMHTSPVQLILGQTPDFSHPPALGEPLHPLSPFQIIDSDAEDELLEKLEYGSQAIRIKGPHRSGKTTLLCRVCYRFIEQHADGPVAIAYLGLDDVLQTPDIVLSKHSEFVSFLTRTINNSVENPLAPFPDISDSPNPRFSFYKYLGQILEINSGIIIIVLDGLEELFQHPQTLKSYEQFFKFFDNKQKIKPYNRVRTIFVNSTDEYVATHHLASPLNVGHVVEISWLNKSHKDAISQLIQAYELPVDDNNCIDEMLSLFGGMPYFIHAALREAKSRGIPLSNVLEMIRAPKSILSNELLSVIDSIRNYDACSQGSNLEGSLKKIVNSDGFVLIGDRSCGITYDAARLLEALGVATINTYKPGQQSVTVSSELYRLFFSSLFGSVP